MKNIRRILYLIIVIFSLNINNAFAADNIKKYPAPDVERRSYSSSTDKAYDQYLYDSILNGLTNLKDKVDISMYSHDSGKVFDVLEKVLDDHPEIFYFNYEKCYFWTNGILELGYKEDKATINTMRQKLNKKVEYVINNVIKENMSDFEKEMAIHDYIVLNTKYSLDDVEGNSSSDLIYTVYGCLVNNSAVCDGYAKAMQLLLNKVGVYTIRVVGNGNGISHAWNIVRINGENYQVDATWNDPVPDSGYIRYKYFNMSDEDISKDHYWVKEDFETCNDNSFRYLHKAGYVVKDSDYIYYSNDKDNNRLYRMSVDGSNNKVLTKDTAINLVYYNNNIYFSNYSDGGTLYKINKDGSNLKKLLDNHVENIHFSKGYLTYFNEDTSQSEKIKLEEYNDIPKEEVKYDVEDQEKFKELFFDFRQWDKIKEVPQNKTWKISFNRELNSQNLKDQIYIMDSFFNKLSHINVNIDQGKNVIVTKKDPYKKGGLYYLVISKPVKDIRGKQIKEPIVMKFKVY